MIKTQLLRKNKIIIKIFVSVMSGFYGGFYSVTDISTIMR